MGEWLSAEVFRLDEEAEVRRIAQGLRDVLRDPLRRRGLVVALSGGVDSSVCAALAVRAVGARRVFGLLLPERDSDPVSRVRGQEVAEGLGIEYQVEDIAPTLEALGCYQRRDEAIRRVFPAYGDAWRCKLVIGGGAGRLHFFDLVVESPDGQRQRGRLGHAEYLQIVAASNFKQRVRKTIEYFHADRLHYAVVGTPNKLEYDQGFFVKNGDGAADVKPIAHLYKTQVYALAHHLGLPRAVCEAAPTTDTYSLAQGQDEFYFGLPYAHMDLALWAHDHGVTAAGLAPALGVSEQQAARVYQDLQAKRSTTAALHLPPILLEAADGRTRRLAGGVPG